MAEEQSISTERIILGIDPGTNYMGYGVLKIIGATPHLMAMGVLDLTKGDMDVYIKLKDIFDHVELLIAKYKPSEFAIESQFFGQNFQSVLKLGRAQGVAIAAALQHRLSIHEYAPLKIKQSITGNGMASKEQVARMLQQTFHITDEQMPKHLDATDAVGVALCHHYETRSKITGAKQYSSWASYAKKNGQSSGTIKKYNGWGDYVNNNTDKVKKTKKQG